MTGVDPVLRWLDPTTRREPLPLDHADLDALARQVHEASSIEPAKSGESILDGRSFRLDARSIDNAASRLARLRHRGEGLVPREEFDPVQRLVAERAADWTPLNTHRSDCLLAGRLFCPRCGARSSASTPEVKARVDELTAKQAVLATASTPVVRLADEATITRYVERLHALLGTGAPPVQRTFLRAWIPRIEADGVTLTLPREPGGGAANSGPFEGSRSSFPPS